MRLSACPSGQFAVGVLAVAAATTLPLRAGHDAPVVSSGWTADVSQSLARTEYAFRAGDEGGTATAPNRAHGLRVTVATRGLTVGPRTAAAPPFRLELALRRAGRAGALRPVAAGRVALAGGRAEIRRAGLIEWFVNEPRGLEHGVTLEGPPPDGDGQLALEYALGGDLLAAPAGPRGMALRDAAGRPALSYGGLSVRDAGGRELPARLRLAPGALTIEIDDAGAAWPLTVDPLLTAAAWTADGGQVGAALGRALAAAGDVNGDGYSDILVGAPLFDTGLADAGRALLYYGSAAGPATTPSWTVDGAQAGAQLGAALG